jgi:urease accessory protein
MQQLLIDELPEQTTFEGAREYVHMTWDERRKPRHKCTTDSGREVKIALPRGTTLTDGTILHREEGCAIIVKSQPESVLVIRPANQNEACLAAHHIGNWHRCLQLTDAGELVAEEDGPLCDWLKKSGIAHNQEKRVFQPNLNVSGHD